MMSVKKKTEEAMLSRTEQDAKEPKSDEGQMEVARFKLVAVADVSAWPARLIPLPLRTAPVQLPAAMLPLHHWHWHWHCSQLGASAM